MDPSANEFLICGVEQPAVVLCACCMHPIHDRLGCTVCSLCLVTESGGRRRLLVGDLVCVVCSVCSTTGVEAATTDEIRRLRSTQTCKVLRYMINSVVFPHTEESETPMFCDHDVRFRTSVLSVPSILLYFTANELAKSALWLLKVVLENVLLKRCLDPKITELTDMSLMFGDACPRSAMLIDIILRSTGIHFFDLSMLGGRSFCMSDNVEQKIVIMQERVECLARIIYGLSASPQDVTELQANFVKTQQSTSALGSAFVSRCNHAGGPTHKHAKECYPRATMMSNGALGQEFEQEMALHKSIAGEMKKYLLRQWPLVHQQLS